MATGFQIRTRKRMVSSELVEAFRQLPVANVSDCMARMFAGGPQLRPVHQHEFVLAGPALTVRCRPGDNLLLHHALDIATPGDVIVVDAGGDLTTAIMGEIMAAIAIKNKVAGIIINGAIRDMFEIRKMGLPLYAAGTTHRGPYKDGPGEINTPIAIGGMVIEAGDLILADGDGVLAVPFDNAKEILSAAKSKKKAEDAELLRISNGTSDRAWVMETLNARGCRYDL